MSRLTVVAQQRRCVGGVEVQQNLLVRLQNLCQLEALLAHSLTLLPNPPSLHTLSGCHPPAALVKKAQVSLTLNPPALDGPQPTSSHPLCRALACRCPVCEPWLLSHHCKGILCCSSRRGSFTLHAHHLCVTAADAHNMALVVNYQLHVFSAFPLLVSSKERRRFIKKSMEIGFHMAAFCIAELLHGKKLYTRKIASCNDSITNAHHCACYVPAEAGTAVYAVGELPSSAAPCRLTTCCSKSAAQASARTCTDIPQLWQVS